MDLSNLFQVLDVWTPSPVESVLILLIGLLIYALPVIIIIIIVIAVQKHKRKNKLN